MNFTLIFAFLASLLSLLSSLIENKWSWKNTICIPALFSLGAGIACLVNFFVFLRGDKNRWITFQLNVISFILMDAFDDYMTKKCAKDEGLYCNIANIRESRHTGGEQVCLTNDFEVNRDNAISTAWSNEVFSSYNKDLGGMLIGLIPVYSRHQLLQFDRVVQASRNIIECTGMDKKFAALCYKIASQGSMPKEGTVIHKDGTVLKMEGYDGVIMGEISYFWKLVENWNNHEFLLSITLNENGFEAKISQNSFDVSLGESIPLHKLQEIKMSEISYIVFKDSSSAYYFGRNSNLANLEVQSFDIGLVNLELHRLTLKSFYKGC